MMRVVVLISGAGSNLRALVEAITKQGLAVQVVAVFSNHAAAKGLQFAKTAAIPAFVLCPSAYPVRSQYDQALLTAIDSYAPDLVLLAGFMLILGPDFVAHFAGRLLNIHPSLLPNYPGLHTHRQALRDGATEHGCSVHFVTETLDGGPIILQGKFTVPTNADEAALRRQVQQLEHRIYPKVVQWMCEGRLCYKDNHAVLDKQCLPHNGYQGVD